VDDMTPDVIEMVSPLPGFENCRRVRADDRAGDRAVRAHPGPRRREAVVSRAAAAGRVARFDQTLDAADRKRLEAAGGETLLWLSIVRIDSNGGDRAFANLRAPLVINPRRMLGLQVISADEQLSISPPASPGLSERTMLVITRKLDEAIVIGDGIEVRVLRVGRDGVRLGVTRAVRRDGAPPRGLQRDLRSQRVLSARRLRRVVAHDRGSLPQAGRLRVLELIPCVFSTGESPNPLIWTMRLPRRSSAGRTASAGMRARSGRRWTTRAGAERCRLRRRRRAAGRITGWTWFLPAGPRASNRRAERGRPLKPPKGFSTPCSDPRSRRTRRAPIFFGYSSAPPTRYRLLAARGFDVERYLYLERSTSGLAAGPEGASWRDSLREPVAVLLSASYDQSRSRAFARDGGLDGWRDYLSQLVTSIGCGIFLPAGCQLVEGADGGLEAAVLTTKISDQTVHSGRRWPSPRTARGRGLATRLVEAALGIAHDAGFTRATLLVGERNVEARRVYEKLGFRENGGLCVGDHLIAQRKAAWSLVLSSP